MNAVQLRVNQKARIVKIHTSINLKRRLFQMGIYEQAFIKLDKVAPLKDPLIFEVDQCRIALRKNLAKQIEVSVDE